MSDSDSKVVAEYEALLQFLYMAPVGLVEATLDGDIVMINPVSAQLLMPLSRDGNLSNLFVALEQVAPELRCLTVAFDRRGTVCDAMHIPLASAPGECDPRVLSLSLLKLDERRLMAVLADVTEQVRRERLRRQNRALLDAVLTGVTDYMLVGLDSKGRIAEWNSSIGRVTGLDATSIRGKSFSLFYPPDSITTDWVRDRLRSADQNGWSLDEGWCVRADQTRFWGSSMVSPLRDRDSEQGGAVAGLGGSGERRYCLVVRDTTEAPGRHELRQTDAAGSSAAGPAALPAP